VGPVVGVLVALEKGCFDPFLMVLGLVAKTFFVKIKIKLIFPIKKMLFAL
jgi:hypothetical protein